MISETSSLSFDQASTICEEFAPIGDLVFHHMRALADDGFEAFVPINEFIELFAADAEELELHKKCVVELAKDDLTRPQPIPIFDDSKVMKSPFILELKERYAAEHNEPAKYVDRTKIDPCLRRSDQLARSDPDAWQRRWDGARAARKDHVTSEVRRHGSGLARKRALGMLDRAGFYRLAMERDASALGLKLKRNRRLQMPIFSRPLNENWEVSFVVEEQGLFFQSPFSGSLDMSLEIRCASWRKDNVQPGKLLHIQYQRGVPGFFGGYNEFESLDELEVLIKAHLRLYELMSPILERGFSRVPS